MRKYIRGTVRCRSYPPFPSKDGSPISCHLDDLLTNLHLVITQRTRTTRKKLLASANDFCSVFLLLVSTNPIFNMTSFLTQNYSLLTKNPRIDGELIKWTENDFSYYESFILQLTKVPCPRTISASFSIHRKKGNSPTSPELICMTWTLFTNQSEDFTQPPPSFISLIFRISPTSAPWTL